MALISELEEKLNIIFSNSESNLQSQKKSISVLRNVSENGLDFIHEVLASAIIRANFFNRNYDDFSPCLFEFPVVESEYYTLMMNVFCPNPKYNTDISITTIHHHSNLHLITTCLYGDGYEGYVFKKEENIASHLDKVNLSIDNTIYHKVGETYTVDSYQNHVVFYPKDITVTLALWSGEDRISFDNSILDKTNTYRKTLNKLSSYFSSTDKYIPSKIIEEQHIRLINGSTINSEYHIAPRTGKYFIQNFFSLLQCLHCAKNEFINSILENFESKSEPLSSWINKYLNSVKINRNFEGYDLYLKDRNISKTELLKTIKHGKS